MGKSINYNARTFDDYKTQLKTFTQKYYSTIINDFNDASIGSWFLDLNAAVGDDLGYYTDRMYQETQLDQAQERKSLLNIARVNNLRVDGKRPSVVEAQWSCFVPMDSTEGKNGPDYTYAPILYKGTQASGGGQIFQILQDLNFSQQFDTSGVSNRTFIPVRDTNGKINGYTITKTCVMSSLENKIYKQPLNATDLKAFIEVILPENNVISIDSVIIKEGFNKTTPTALEFMTDSDDRWYEVSNFTEDKIFTKDLTLSQSFSDKILTEITGETGITGATTYGNTFVGYLDDNSKVYGFIPNIGSWANVSRKFITEYTDQGYCKIIFGGGSNDTDLTNKISNASDFAKYQINKIMNNRFLGELPPADSTIYIYYSVGGGSSSNIAAGAMTSIPYVNMSMDGTDAATISKVKNSIAVTNTIPSISGRDELSNDEVRYMIKYNNSAQDRCVTIKDYINRITMMPSEYGSPLKVGVSEVNNKVLITLLGLSYDGTLSQNISQIMIDNMITYLSEYRMINDYVEIQPGKILNIGFEVDVTVDSGQDLSTVAKAIALYIGDYMDVNNHKLGEEIYVSKIKSAVGTISGVKNLIDLRVYNIYKTGYSNNHTQQTIVGTTQTQERAQIDLTASDGVLYSNDDTMFEIKKPKVDIIINTKYK
jgi:hypothetical protein